MKLKKFLKDNYIVLITVAVCILIFARIDQIVIESIRSAGEQVYYVNPRVTTEAAPENTTYSCNVNIVGNSMRSLDIGLNGVETVSGSFDYKIMDADGNLVIQGNGLSAREAIAEDNSYLSIDVTDAGLMQAQEYDVEVTFRDCVGFQLNINGENEELLILQRFDFVYQKLLVLAVIAINVIALAFIFALIKWGLKPITFFLLMLISGIILVFVNPPASKDDEFRHFVRAYALAVNGSQQYNQELDGTEYGNFAGGPLYDIVTIPADLNEIRHLDFTYNYDNSSYAAEQNTLLCLDKLSTVLQQEPKDETAKVSDVAVSHFGAIHYWPQVIAIKTAKLLGVRAIWWYYWARIGQVLACALLGLLAIKLAGEFKDFIWLITFIPNVMTLRASNNPDGLLFMEIILAASILLFMKEKKIDIISREGVTSICAFFFVVYNVAVMKVPYALECMMFLLLLGKDNFAWIGKWTSEHKKVTKYITIGTIGIVIVFAFTLMPVILKKVALLYIPQAHMDYIMENPVAVFGLFKGTASLKMTELYEAMKGVQHIAYPLIMFFALHFCKRKLPYWKQGLFLLGAYGMIYVILLVGYCWNSPDATNIWGITYRYLLPILPLAGLGVAYGNDGTQEKSRTIYPVLIVMVIFTFCVWVVSYSKV